MKLKDFPLYLLLLVSCACSHDVSFATLEEARGTARENALYNAQGFRAGNVQYQSYVAESRGDSTQAPDCPQGDGWATLQLVNPDNHNDVVKLKCSTVSAEVGCLTQAEFQTKSWASDDGHCQDASKVPFPLPKIAK